MNGEMERTMRILERLATAAERYVELLHKMQDARTSEAAQPPSKADRQEHAASLYASGMSMREVGIALGVTGGTARRYVVEGGGTVRTRGGHKASAKLTDEVKARIVELHESHHGFNEIRDDVNVTMATIGAVLDEAGYEKQGRGLPRLRKSDMGVER